MAREIWLPIPDYPNYAASSRGRIRIVKTKHKITSFSLSNRGYLTVELSTATRKCRRLNVHSLIAAAFLGPRPEGLEVNHKSGVKTENFASNLEYVSHRENCIHRSQLGLWGTKMKLNVDAVRAIKELIGSGLTLRAIAQQFDVTYQCIGAIKSGRTWYWIDLPNRYPASMKVKP
jgi:hypothetical protein